MLKLLTVADKILIAILVCAFAGSFTLVSALAHEGTTVIVEVQGSPVFKLNLLEERTVQINGAHGALQVQSQAGKVAVIEADCPNHVCVRTGWRSRAGDVIVCVPNKTVVRILKEERNDDVDAVTG